GVLLDEVVRAAAPDVLLVNEAPKTPLLWRRQARGLAERWGMRHVVGGRDAGSNMILVGPGVDVRSARARTLPQPLFQPRRGIAAAQLRVRGRLVGVVACHLSLDAARRETEVGEVLSTAGRLRGPVVVGGDLNEGPRGPSWRRLRAAGFVDAGSAGWPTFPATAPTKRIDALLVRGGARVVHHGDPGVDEDLQARASDHRPVMAVLEI
ncbi:MAG TPA: endonuclease/exonuclease/phosphatase family protein, partial [Nocardioidaceae bacterium]